MEILEEVQGLIKHPNGRDFIYKPHLERWRKDQAFTSPQGESKRLCIDGHVPGGDAKTRGQQEAFLSPDNRNGGEQFQMVKIEDLAVAFSLHWVATGEPLFGRYYKQSWSYTIRAVGDALNFDVNGLRADSIGVGNDNDIIGFSACVSPE